MIDKINDHASRGTLLTPRHVRSHAEGLAGRHVDTAGSGALCGDIPTVSTAGSHLSGALMQAGGHRRDPKGLVTPRDRGG